MRVTDFFELNYRPRKLRGRSQNTLRLYRASIRKLDKTLGRPAMLDDFCDDTVAAVMQSVLDSGGSPATANKERSQLLAIWRFAAQTGLIKTWPTITAENEPVRVPVAWLQDDVISLLDAIDKLDGCIATVPARLWWRAIVLICLDTGERIGAVFQAEWSWIERNWILVPAEARKGRKRDRRYLLTNETMHALAEVRKFSPRSIRVFPWPYCATYLWTKFTKLLESAGLPAGRKDKFHKFRKTHGSVVYAAGLDAQDILDHQNKRTTQAYLDPRFSRQTQASDILAAWLRNPGVPNEQRKAQ